MTNFIENVIERDLWIEKGKKIGGFSSANEAIGTLVLRFNAHNDLERVLKNQDKYIRVDVSDWRREYEEDYSIWCKWRYGEILY